MVKSIAAHFWKELAAVAPELIGRSFTVNDDGSVLESNPEGEGLTDEEKDIVYQVWLEHDPSNNPEQYKLDRAREYPPIGDQLDAILKHFKSLQDAGNTLPPDLTQIIESWQDVKLQYPKE